MPQWQSVDGMFFHSHHFDDTRPGKPVNLQKTMENRHVQWINPLLMAIFNSYVKLPKGRP